MLEGHVTVQIAEQPYCLRDDGIYEPVGGVSHRDHEYPDHGFATLLRMQQEHFWYRGRHRFLLHALDRHLPKGNKDLRAIDLGGGVGGWVRYLSERRPDRFASLALADSSEAALMAAATVLPPTTDRYRVDLMDLLMREAWDVAFMLDVIEHIPDDQRALRETANAMKSGGLIFVTTPAFKAFWSYNDEVAQHQRRYRRTDFAALADATGLTLLDARYFMFVLSPLYLLSRLKPGVRSMDKETIMKLVQRQHETPNPIINAALGAAFSVETPLGHHVRFPWGTSILGVFQRL